MKAAPTVQPLLTFGQCLKNILGARKLSASALSRMMEQKSRNSMFRILDDTGGPAVQAAFFESLKASDCLHLTEQEERELERALEVSRFGVAGYMTNQAMHRLLGDVDLQAAADDSLRVDRSLDGSVTTLRESMEQLAAEQKRVHFVITGCCHRKVFERIAAAFPYIESMEIQNRTVDTVCITVREATAAGAVYFDGGWLVVSAAGKGLEKLPISSDRPPRLRYIKGAVLREEAGVGKASLDERSLAIVRTLTDGFSRYGFDEVSEIDLSDLTDITFLMEGTLRVKLGSDGNLEQELEVLSTTIPKLKNTYGSKLRGVVDASSYSREGATARVVYTPQEVAEGNF